MSGLRVLVVDNEPQIQHLLQRVLEACGYEVWQAETGREAIRRFSETGIDAVLLDLDLPDIGGKEVLVHIRKLSYVPVIIVSGQTHEADKIAVLDLGADDYVQKPFTIGELLARLRVALRRTPAWSGPRIEIEGLTIDIEMRVVTRDGQRIKLTPREYSLLCTLAHHTGRVLTHSELLARVWGPAHTHDTPTLRVFIGQLRAKIEHDPAKPTIIRTESGVGYRFGGVN